MYNQLVKQSTLQYLYLDPFHDHAFFLTSLVRLLHQINISQHSLSSHPWCFNFSLHNTHTHTHTHTQYKEKQKKC